MSSTSPSGNSSTTYTSPKVLLLVGEVRFHLALSLDSFRDGEDLLSSDKNLLANRQLLMDWRDPSRRRRLLRLRPHHSVTLPIVVPSHRCSFGESSSSSAAHVKAKAALVPPKHEPFGACRHGMFASTMLVASSTMYMRSGVCPVLTIIMAIYVMRILRQRNNLSDFMFIT